MIQRIQTIHLLIGAVLLSLIYLFPLASFNSTTGHWLLYSATMKNIDGVSGLIPVFPIALVNGLAVLVSIFAIFSFKNRLFQIKLCKLNYFILLVLLAIITIYMMRISTMLNAPIAFKFVLVFPVVSLILNYLAHQAVKRDEKLVKSADRIR